MKYIALLPIVLVAACAQSPDDVMVYYDDEEVVTYENENEFIPQEDFAEFEEIDVSVEAIPTTFGDEKQGEGMAFQQPTNGPLVEAQGIARPIPTQPQSTSQSIYQPVVTQDIPQPASVTKPVMPSSQMQAPYIQPSVLTHHTSATRFVSNGISEHRQSVPYQYTTKTMPDGNIVIELPPQQIYLPEESYYSHYVVQPQDERTPISVSQPVGQSVNEENSIQPTVVPILLQHREQPDLQVQCQSNDVTCITSFEQQGYVQVRYMPHVAGYKDIPAVSDYPETGRWRHQNNIPRW